MSPTTFNAEQTESLESITKGVFDDLQKHRIKLGELIIILTKENPFRRWCNAKRLHIIVHAYLKYTPEIHAYTTAQFDLYWEIMRETVAEVVACVAIVDRKKIEITGRNTMKVHNTKETANGSLVRFFDKTVKKCTSLGIPRLKGQSKGFKLNNQSMTDTDISIQAYSKGNPNPFSTTNCCTDPTRVVGQDKLLDQEDAGGERLPPNGDDQGSHAPTKA